MKAIEKTLFDAADKMRGAMDAGEYKHVALGMLFLRYVSMAFENQRREISSTEWADPDDRDEYIARRAFWVPTSARWDVLRGDLELPDIGARIDRAMSAIESENDGLDDALPKVFGRLDPDMVRGLFRLFDGLPLAGTPADFDLIGRVYEYCIGQFAAAEGKRGGEFYTPKAIVEILVGMTEPMQGRIYDPCCGTGGFFVQSEKFLKAHQGNPDAISLYGQERNKTTWRLARMNLAIRGIVATHIAWNTEGTLKRDAFPDERFDVVLANPPFNIKDWDGDLLRSDPRWRFGIPPKKNANFAWIQHIYVHLAPGGLAGVVMANSSLDPSPAEKTILRGLLEADAIDAIVSLPSQLFFGTQIPACLWVLANDRSGAHGRPMRDRRGEVLFIDAREMGSLVPGSRKIKDLSADEIAKVVSTYRRWAAPRPGETHEDVLGFCRSVPLAEIAAQGHSLTPGRYVGAAAPTTEEKPFPERMAQILAELDAHQAKAKHLDDALAAALRSIRHGW
jgi:type I restriction enzyme M protein